MVVPSFGHCGWVFGVVAADTLCNLSTMHTLHTTLSFAASQIPNFGPYLTDCSIAIVFWGIWLQQLMKISAEVLVQC